MPGLAVPKPRQLTVPSTQSIRPDQAQQTVHHVVGLTPAARIQGMESRLTRR
ncbi:hypothetical protein RISK_003981 [Rhodopirellula islandica]|uniref:Uncharacterized protein n=1 Tax=Rhodopirellula islandica TaxID=595434 RepID=A0A0J1BBJ6_RHOIS|nr:hypothetical protein RISK_003981 [Rhodopirellula islandica]